MKKTIALLMSCLVLVGLFSACGAQDSGETTVDLEAFYEQVTGEHELAAMEDLDSALLENNYPGLTGYTFQQCVVMVECSSADDAAAVAKILQDRIDTQVDGGAWYPASIEQWKQAQVVTNGSYVALIACSDQSASIAEAFLAQF